MAAQAEMNKNKHLPSQHQQPPDREPADSPSRFEPDLVEKKELNPVASVQAALAALQAGQMSLNQLSVQLMALGASNNNSSNSNNNNNNGNSGLASPGGLFQSQLAAVAARQLSHQQHNNSNSSPLLPPPNDLQVRK